MTDNEVKSEKKLFASLKFSLFEELAAFVNKAFPENGTAVFYLDHALLFAAKEKDRLLFEEENTFDPVYLQKCRIFNDKQELHIWRRDIREYSARLRTDGTGKKTHYQDTEPFILGQTAKISGNGFAVLTEDRGSNFSVPVSGCDSPSGEFRLRQRYYIEFNAKTHQAGYTDMRFVSIEPYSR